MGSGWSSCVCVTAKRKAWIFSLEVELKAEKVTTHPLIHCTYVTISVLPAKQHQHDPVCIADVQQLISLQSSTMGLGWGCIRQRHSAFLAGGRVSVPRDWRKPHTVAFLWSWDYVTGHMLCNPAYARGYFPRLFSGKWLQVNTPDLRRSRKAWDTRAPRPQQPPGRAGPAGWQCCSERGAARNSPSSCNPATYSHTGEDHSRVRYIFQDYPACWQLS